MQPYLFVYNTSYYRYFPAIWIKGNFLLTFPNFRFIFKDSMNLSLSLDLALLESTALVVHVRCFTYFACFHNASASNKRRGNAMQVSMRRLLHMLIILRFSSALCLCESNLYKEVQLDASLRLKYTDESETFAIYSFASLINSCAYLLLQQ